MRIIFFSDDTRIRTSEGQDYKRKVYLLETTMSQQQRYLPAVLFFYVQLLLCILAKHRCTTQLAKLSFNHSIGRTHSWRFSIFIKNIYRFFQEEDNFFPRSMTPGFNQQRKPGLQADSLSTRPQSHIDCYLFYFLANIHRFFMRIIFFSMTPGFEPAKATKIISRSLCTRPQYVAAAAAVVYLPVSTIFLQNLNMYHFFYENHFFPPMTPGFEHRDSNQREGLETYTSK